MLDGVRMAMCWISVELWGGVVIAMLRRGMAGGVEPIYTVKVYSHYFVALVELPLAPQLGLQVLLRIVTLRKPSRCETVCDVSCCPSMVAAYSVIKKIAE